MVTCAFVDVFCPGLDFAPEPYERLRTKVEDLNIASWKQEWQISH